MYTVFISILLFYLLSPGIFIELPKTTSKNFMIVLYSLVFAIIFEYIQEIIC